jgi:UV DNA damage endonuclease
MIGLCCQFLEEVTSPRGKVSHKNIFEESILQYNKFLQNSYPQEKIVATWVKNISKVKEILPKVYNSGIRSFRLSSNYFPLNDKLDGLLESNQKIRSILSDIGQFVIKNKMRASCHPSQFVVLSSKNPNVIKNSVENLTHHAWVLDSMGLDASPYYAINIHGGVRGESKMLIEQANALPANIKNRLTFENDERSYSVKDLYQVYRETGVPITYDFHHDTFNNSGLNHQEKIKMVMESWGRVKPLMHLSNTEPEFMDSGSFTEKRKHSFYTHYIPSPLLELINGDECDCDWEFKGKNLAIFKAVEDFKIKLN